MQWHSRFDHRFDRTWSPEKEEWLKALFNDKFSRGRELEVRRDEEIVKRIDDGTDSSLTLQDYPLYERVQMAQIDAADLGDSAPGPQAIISHACSTTTKRLTSEGPTGADLPLNFPTEGLTSRIADDVLSNPWVFEFGYDALMMYLRIKYGI